MDLDERTSRAIDALGIDTPREQAARGRLDVIRAGLEAVIARRKSTEVIEHQRIGTVTKLSVADGTSGVKIALPPQALSSDPAPPPDGASTERDTSTPHKPSTCNRITTDTGGTSSKKPLSDIKGAIQAVIASGRYRQPPLHPLRAHRRNQTIHLPWNVLPHRMRLENIHYVLCGLAGQELQHHAAFSLNFDRAFERDLPVDSARGFVWRALHRHLKRAGLACHMVMILERARVPGAVEQAARTAAGLDPLWRLHAHGELACRPESLPGLAATMRKATGLWGDDAADYQLDLKPSPDRHWLASYVTKAGDSYSCTADLRRKAEDRWEEWRGNENERRRKAAATKARRRKNILARRRYRLSARDSFKTAR